MSQNLRKKIAILQASEKMSKIFWVVFFFSDGERKGKCINRSYKSQIPNFLLSCIPALS